MNKFPGREAIGCFIVVFKNKHPYLEPELFTLLNRTITAKNFIISVYLSQTNHFVNQILSALMRKWLGGISTYCFFIFGIA